MRAPDRSEPAGMLLPRWGYAWFIFVLAGFLWAGSNFLSPGQYAASLSVPLGMLALGQLQERNLGSGGSWRKRRRESQACL